MSTAKDRKNRLRREYRQRRRDIDSRRAAAAAQRCSQALCASSVWQYSAHIALYQASDGELDPLPIARRARDLGRRLYLPRLADAALEFVDWRAGQQLPVNRYGIGEPRGPARPLLMLDLVLLPLVAWSANGVRLGMGAGYYDRTLAALPTAKRPTLVGLGYAMQAVDELPVDPWDVNLDAVLTEEGLRYCG